LIAGLLEKRGIPHQVLNAKHHQREAEIVAQAGRLGAVTIATNMAGRGTDIILGGNPEAMAWAQLQEKYPTRLEVPQEEWDTLVREIEQREQMKAEGRVVAGMGGLHIVGTERHEAGESTSSFAAVAAVRETLAAAASTSRWKTT